MKKFIKHYVNPNEKDMNFGLINKEYDDDIVDYIIDCCKSLEVIQHIKFLGYEYITRESDIDTSEYILSRSRSKTNKREIVKYMYTKDNRCWELQLKFQLTCDGETEVITKKLLVPIPDEDGYYTIRGTRYMLMNQIVDASTYTTKKSLVLKSMMPISIRTWKVEYSDIRSVKYTAPIYTMGLFRKDINIILFYLAKMGLDRTLYFMSVDKLVDFCTEVDETSETDLYFNVNSKLYIKVDKYFFEQFEYVRSVVFMLLEIMTNRMSLEDIYDTDMWLLTLGGLGTVNKNKQREKADNTLIYLNRIIDDTTKKVLKVHPMHKQDIYTILRWMIQSFSELQKKDNLDLENRRLRCNEYIASLLTKAFSERINSIISLGNRVTMRNLKSMFKFSGDILIRQLHSSGLLRFDDKTNDMDFFSKLKVTFKGPNSLGGNNDNNIAAKYRGISPSYLGRLDINVCGTSDPGTSAVLTPFCKTHKLFFSDAREPEDFKYNFDKTVEEKFMKDHSDGLFIGSPMDNLDDYYDFSLQAMELLTSNDEDVDNSDSCYYITGIIDDESEEE